MPLGRKLHKFFEPFDNSFVAISGVKRQVVVVARINDQFYDLALASKMAMVAETEKLDLLHGHYAIPPSISAHSAKFDR